jgi:nitroreductase
MNQFNSLMKFLDLAKNRYSCRSYKSIPVEDEKLNYILETARIAPSAANKQPWHIVVIRDTETRKNFFGVYQREWFAQAPVHLVICGSHQNSWKRSYDNWDALYIDMGIIADHMTLAATEQGLATCWICAFNPSNCRKILNLPDDIEPVVILPLGYPADVVNPDRHNALRKKSEDIIHWDKF